MSNSQIYSENREVGSFDFDLTLDCEMQEVLAVPPKQLGLTDFKIGSDLTVRLDGDPDSATAKLGWDADQ
jgi:hypothetical protein